MPDVVERRVAPLATEEPIRPTMILGGMMRSVVTMMMGWLGDAAKGVFGPGC